MAARPHHHVVTGSHRSIHHLALVGVMLASLAAGLVSSFPAAADGCGTARGLEAHAGLTRSHRSIVLLEGRDPGHFAPDGLTAHAGLSPSHRAIVLLEGRDPGHYPVAIASSEGLDASGAMSQSHRSIVIIEGQDPANVPTAMTC